MTTGRQGLPLPEDRLKRQGLAEAQAKTAYDLLGAVPLREHIARRRHENLDELH